MSSITSNEFLILAVLRGDESYGREIMKAVEELTGGRHKLPLGGLYTTLHRMEKKRLIEGRWGERPREEPFAQRRYYRLTGLGRRHLAEAEQALAPALAAIREGRS